MPPKAKAPVSVGQAVQVTGMGNGVVSFVGTIKFQPGFWCGITLDAPKGKTDGTYQGARLFTCGKNHGVFIPLAKLGTDFYVIQSTPAVATGSPAIHPESATQPSVPSRGATDANAVDSETTDQSKSKTSRPSQELHQGPTSLSKQSSSASLKDSHDTAKDIVQSNPVASVPASASESEKRPVSPSKHPIVTQPQTRPRTSSRPPEGRRFSEPAIGDTVSKMRISQDSSATGLSAVPSTPPRPYTRPIVEDAEPPIAPPAVVEPAHPQTTLSPRSAALPAGTSTPTKGKPGRGSPDKFGMPGVRRLVHPRSPASPARLPRGEMDRSSATGAKSTHADKSSLGSEVPFESHSSAAEQTDEEPLASSTDQFEPDEADGMTDHEPDEAIETKSELVTDGRAEDSASMLTNTTTVAQVEDVEPRASETGAPATALKAEHEAKLVPESDARTDSSQDTVVPTTATSSARASLTSSSLTDLSQNAPPPPASSSTQLSAVQSLASSQESIPDTVTSGNNRRLPSGGATPRRQESGSAHDQGSPNMSTSRPMRALPTPLSESKRKLPSPHDSPSMRRRVFDTKSISLDERTNISAILEGTTASTEPSVGGVPRPTQTDSSKDPFIVMQQKMVGLTMELANAKSTCSSLTATLASVTEERDQARTQVVELSDLRSKAFEIESANAMLTEQLAATKTSMVNAIRDLNEAHAKQVLAVQAEATHIRASTSAAMAEKDTKIAVLTCETESLALQLHSLKTQFDELKLHHDQTLTSLQSAADSSSTAVEQLTQAQAAEIKRLEQLLEAERQEHSHSKSIYEQKLHDFEAKVQELTVTHEAALQERQKTIQELEDSLEEMDQESMQARREAEATMQELRSSLDSLRTHYDDATTKNHQLQQEALQAAHDHSLEIQQLNTQLSQQSINIAELQAVVDSSRDEHERTIKSLREEMEILRADNAQLSASIQTLHSLEKQREQDPTSQALKHLPEELKSMQLVIDMQTSKLKESRRRCAELEDQLAAINHTKLRDDLQFYQQQNEELELTLDSKRKAYEAVSAELAKVKEQCASLDEENRRLLTEKEELTYKLTTAAPSPAGKFNASFAPSPEVVTRRVHPGSGSSSSRASWIDPQTFG